VSTPDVSDEFTAECENLFGVDVVAYWPVNEDPPEGWEVVGPLSHHHGQYSKLIRPRRDAQGFEAL